MIKEKYPQEETMHILVVDDDEVLRLSLKLSLEGTTYVVDEAQDGSEALSRIKDTNYSAVILDVNMPGINGIETLEKIKEYNPEIFCLILTAHSDVKDAVRAIKLGAYDYIEKPIDTEQLIDILKAAKEAKDLVTAAAFSAPSVKFDENRSIIGGSSEINKVFSIIYKLSKVDTAVLVRGESGTGKELVARAVHYNSHRKKGPFVAVNLAAIPENLIESELFGHEKGAFTGADKRKIGKFQFAAGGTIFLDEIGDISPGMQVKLLRVLQEKTIIPVGSNHEINIDLRIVAATNKPLEKMITEDKFRADLFYRLNVLPITLPPLRERTGDIPPLADYMITKFNKSHNRTIQGLSNLAMSALLAYKWPGNIRELENVIEHAFIMESSDHIQIHSLPAHIIEECEKSEFIDRQVLKADRTIDEKSIELNYPILKEKFERDFIIKALKTFNGRVNQTAVHTKMTKVTLLRKLEKYGINPKNYYPNS